MTLPPFELSTGDIAQHSPWMQRLASGLLRDPAAADDVVQDAWTKLAGAPRRPGYLAAVVRSLARSRYREERRRSQRERGSARSEALPSAAQVAERAELARRLAEAVEGIEEPYRTTIVLRYYDDLSSAEIARRSGTPAATVRTRVKRGLDLLRARLDERHGGRTKWVGALLPMARAGGKGPSSVLVASALTVLSMKMVLALALVLAALAVTWTVTSRSADPEGLTLVLGPDEKDRPDATGLPAERTPTEASPVLAGRAALKRPSEPPGKTPALAAGRGLLRARAVSATGAALRDSWLRLRLAPENEAAGEDDGLLALDVEPGLLERLALRGNGRTLEIEIGAKGHRSQQLRPYLPEGVLRLELGEVKLTRGGAVHGRVVDEGGLGIEGALVVVGMPSVAEPGDTAARLRGPLDLEAGPTRARAPALVGRSEPGGEFHLDGVAPGYATVWARSATSLWSFSEPVGVRAGEEVFGIELVLFDEPERIIGGRVVDPDGRPLAGVGLTLTKSNSEDGWHNVSTDVRGDFYFAPQDGAAQDITVRSPSWEWGDQERLEVAPGTLDLEIAFEGSRWLAIHVEDVDGKPIGNGRLVGLPGSGPTDRPLARCESPLDTEGHGRLRRPDVPMRVRAEAPGYRDRILGPFDPGHFPKPLLVTLERVPALVGQVRRADGRPAAHARVSLHRSAGGSGGVTPPGGAGSGPYLISHQGWSGDGEPFVYRLMVAALAEVSADDQGRYRLPLPGVESASSDEVDSPRGVFAGMGYMGGRKSVASAKAGQAWYVHAALEGAATVTSGPHVFEATLEVELDLSLPRGGSVAGRLAFADGSSTAGWTARASDALARVAEAPVATDGTFLLENLHAGGWQVRVFAPGRRYFPGSMRTSRTPGVDVEVVAGRTVEYEHVTNPRATARLHGRLWVDGAPAGPWRVSVRTSTPQAAITSHETTLDPDGRFEVTLEPGLKTTLSIHRGAGDFSVMAHPTIVVGRNGWSFDLNTARLEGTLVVSELTGWAGSRPTYESEVGGVTIRTRLTVLEDGRFGPALVPAGLGRLRGPRTGFRDPAPIWAELDLKSGETRRIDLR